MNRIRLLFSSYILVIVGLFFYSFTQVDLGLTLSRNVFFHSIEKNFQYIGYFNRPLSTLIFLIIIALLLVYYLIFVYLALKNKINTSQIWFLTIFNAVILTFCYNAFSYDLFNYIFDAKLITFYHVNPYFYKALDFPHEPMLGFMHWVHRTYPYGPFWLVLTAPLSFIGLNYFIPTLFLFKTLVSFTFLICAYFLQKIAKEIYPKYEAFILASFVFSPFILIEVLVDSHNDMPMIALGIISIYFALKKKWIVSIITVILAALTKQAALFLIIPVFSYIALSLYKKWNMSFENFIKVSIAFMFLAFFYAISTISLQPWYFLWVFPLLLLLKPNRFIFLVTTGFSIGLMLRYAPFLYRGDFNGMVNQLEVLSTILPTVIGFVVAALLSLFFKVNNKK